MSLLLWGMTLSVVGKGLLALGIIWVHITMATERSIDAEVIKSFRFEMIITIIGFLMIVAGYLIEVQALGGFGTMASCEGAECAAALGAV